MRGKPHNEDTKAAVMAALLAGQPITDTAKAFNVPETTVRQWAKGDEIVEVRNKRGELIAEKTFGYLTTLLTSLTEQAKIVGTKEYISKQSAADVAVLHGVMADKGFRLLAAIAVTSQSAQTGERGSTAEQLPRILEGDSSSEMVG